MRANGDDLPPPKSSEWRRCTARPYPNKYLASKKIISITNVDTGMNDKYAYGIATRTVQMSRGNRQGTNAFLDDTEINHSNSLNATAISFMLEELTDIDIFGGLLLT